MKSRDANIEILIAEDSRTQAEQLRYILEEHGHRVAVANNGKQALAAVQERKPDILISDIVMPEMDGYALCKAIKSDERLKDIPVILVTTLSDPQDIIKGLKCGADNFIKKPYGEKYLLSRIAYLQMNRETRSSERLQWGLEIYLAGERHLINSERQQMLDLLMSTYEQAIEVNDELKARQQELARSNQTLDALYRMAEGINHALSEQQVANTALERVTELPGIRCGWIFLKASLSPFRLAAARGRPSFQATPEALNGDCQCLRRLVSGELDQAENIFRCECLQGIKDDIDDLRPHASIPLHNDGKPIGVMNLMGTESGSFTDEALKTLQTIGNQLGMALGRAWLYEHLEQQVTERTAALTEEIAERKFYETQLQYQATHDALTGLPNRALLQDRLQHALAQAHRTGRRVAVLFIDLDRFKPINDSVGHAAGDILLKTVAERLKASVREGDTVARQGGDEFVIVLPEDQLQENIVDVVARRVLNVLAMPFTMERQEFFISTSIGISLYPKDGEDPGTLLKHADIAMYRAKQLGGNTLQFYARAMNAQLRERLALEKDLRYALERGELEPYYQPQVELETGRIIGAEVLLRWRHPERGMVSPAEFIPLAEETGLIIPIGEWVLRQTCAQAKAWQDTGLPPLTIGVNLSSRQFMQPDLIDTVAQILQEADLEASCLELEITESLLMENVEGTIHTLQTLKDMGVQLAIDDFGTGYSSLSYLKRFPIGRLKIDKSFVRDITTDPDDAAITLAIIAMAHSMKLKVIAEGVETQEQLAFLRSRHCDELQGYYFSRPLPAGEMAELLRENRLLQLPQQEETMRPPRTLLLVDDEAEITASLSRLLRREDYRILTANSAREGLELLAQHQIGVVIADQLMPEMNGVEFLRRVREFHPHTVRIMLSGHSDLNSLADAINEGAIFKFFSKPVSIEHLRKSLHEAFLIYEMLSQQQAA